MTLDTNTEVSNLGAKEERILATFEATSPPLRHSRSNLVLAA
jgi:hypothetical protein